MITIQSVMLVALGVLIAALISLVILPHYRRRTVRLTTDELKRAMPLTEAEISADKDRLRAGFAIHIHDLETKIERASLAAARQRVEINRRDAAISALEGDMSGMRTSLDEHENARRVLEHTITDRLPRVEQRLKQAKRLLFQRDREIASLSETAERQSSALEEATQINTKNRDEVHRLTAALATRAARGRDGSSDAHIEGEIALRSEIEALRAKTKDQAALIGRLQGLMARSSGAVASRASGAASGGNGLSISKSTSSDKGAGLTALGRAPEEEIASLRNELSEAEQSLRELRGSAAAGQAGASSLRDELSRANATIQDQKADVAQLTAALEAYRAVEQDTQAVAESKMAMKAQLASLRAQTGEQDETIKALRAEIAKSNERLARQGAHFMEEMRRLGGGTTQTSGVRVSRTREGAGSRSAALGDAAGLAASSKTRSRRPLSERISEPRVPANDHSGVAAASPKQRQKRSLISRAVEKVGGSRSEPADVSAQAGDAVGTGSGDDGRVSGFLRALDGAGHSETGSAAADNVNGESATRSTVTGDKKSVAVSASAAKKKIPSGGEGGTASVLKDEPEAVSANNDDGAAEPSDKRPGGLLERITRLDRPRRRKS